jgi:hypothetical protein
MKQRYFPFALSEDTSSQKAKRDDWDIFPDKQEMSHITRDTSDQKSKRNDWDIFPDEQEISHITRDGVERQPKKRFSWQLMAVKRHGQEHQFRGEESRDLEDGRFNHSVRTD